MFIKGPAKLNFSEKLSILPLEKCNRSAVEVVYFFFPPQHHIKLGVLKHIYVKGQACFRHFRWVFVMELLTFSQTISTDVFSGKSITGFSNLPKFYCQYKTQVVCMSLDACNLRLPKASHMFAQLIIRQSLLEGPWASLDAVFNIQVNGIRTVLKKKKKKSLPMDFVMLHEYLLHEYALLSNITSV